MSNRKFYEAVLRDALPISREHADKGWPPILYPWFLALMQLPDADKPAQKAFTLHMGDSIRAGALPAERQRIPWFIENEVIEPHVTAQDFAAWLAREGMEPSPLVSEWFAHQGVTSPAPVHAAAPARARLPPKLPLPHKMSAIAAAEILGGGYLLEYVMHLVAVGDMASWSHSPAKGELRRHKDHVHGTETALPRIGTDTDPASVFVAGDDVLWHWCVLAEEDIHRPASTPKKAVERRLESVYALQRVPAPAQPQAAVPSPVVTDSPDDGEAWKVKARDRANEIIKRQRERDLHPSQENIADEIAREFREGGIVGAGGKPLTGAYIKRHALKGISSAKGRQLSTSIRRGK